MERMGPQNKLNFNFFESKYKDVLKKNPILGERIDVFMKNISLKYISSHVDLIRRAVVVGVVAHQNNENETKRYRKNSTAPYFIHPLEMAESMVSQSEEGPTFDWITVATALLHDVPEDVKLNGIEGREAWLSTIEEIFKDSGYQYMLTSIIDGVTERKLPPRNENEKLYQRIEKAPIYKMIAGYTQEGGIRHPKEKSNNIDEEKRKSITEVVYNLEHLFLSAIQTPEELRIFFIKIADVWHNLQSPEWIKDYKVLRGRIAAGLADLLGWDFMRDEIIVSLAKITDVTTPFTPDNTDKNQVLFSEELETSATQEMSEDIKIVEKAIPKIIKELKDQPIKIKGGFPLPQSSDDYNRRAKTPEGETTLPQPEIRVKMPTESIKNFRKDLEHYGILRIWVRDGRNKRGYTSVTIKHRYSLMNELNYLLGREQVFLIIEPGNRKSFKLQIEDDLPHIIDMFTLHNNQILPSQIPELGLLHSDFSQDESLLSTHIQTLIGLCYDPSLIGQVGEGIVPVFHHASGRLFFLPKTLHVKDVSEICNIPELEASYPLEKTLWKLCKDKFYYMSKHALRRIIVV